MALLSRRAWIASASSLLLWDGSKAHSAPNPQSSPRFGRITLGLGSPTYYGTYFPFIDLWKNSGGIEVQRSGVMYESRFPAGHPRSAWPLLDQDGYLKSPIAAGVTLYKRLIYGPPAGGATEGFNIAGVPLVIKFDGVGTLEVINANGKPLQRGGRALFSLASNASNTYVYWTNINPNNPVRNVRLCKAEHEKRLDAGELFDPGWFAEIKKAAGIIRMITWQHPHTDCTTLRFEDIPQASYHHWGSGGTTPSVKGGTPLKVLTQLANQAQSHAWVSIPYAYGVEKLSEIETISRTSPAVVTSYNHKFTDGDQVTTYYNPPGWADKFNYLRWTVKNANRAAGTFELAGFDAADRPAYDRLYRAKVSTLFDLGRMTRELVPYFEYFRDNLDRSLVAYFEYGNEVWLPAGGTVQIRGWLMAQAWLRYGKPERHVQMAGYITAHCMKVARDVFGTGNRQRWRGVLCPWTANPGTASELLAGASEYIAEHVPRLAVSDLFDAIACTGYWSGGPHGAKHKATLFAWMDESEARWRKGQEPTKHSHYNRLVNEERYDGRHLRMSTPVTVLPKRWAPLKAIADKHKLALIQYEGGDHDEMHFSGLWAACSPPERLRLMEFYKSTTHSPEQAANYAAMFQSFEAMGGQYPAKFVDIGPVTQYGSWGGLRYVGDSNPVWDAVVSFNRR